MNRCTDNPQNMNNMEAIKKNAGAEDEPFVIERIYNAPLELVWKAITDKNEMKQWYFPDLDQFKAEVGTTFEFYGSKDEKRYLHLCKVIEVIENKKISYTWTYKDYPGSSIVTFELFPEGNKTKLRLTHVGLKSFPSSINPDFARESFAGGWRSFIGSRLKDFVEKN